MSSLEVAFSQGFKESIEKRAQDDPSPAMRQLSNMDNPYVSPSKMGKGPLLAYGAMMLPGIGMVGRGALSAIAEPYAAQDVIESNEPGYNLEMMTDV